MSAPRVSVVVPVYNTKDYLAEAVRSIQAQTYQDLEIILVDDGSTDGSREVIESFGSEVRGIFQKNSGPSAARNAGIQAARGEFVAFCDADDVQHPYRIAMHMAVLEQKPKAALVAGDLSEWIDGKVTREHALHDLWIGPRRAPFDVELEQAFGAWSTVEAMQLPAPERFAKRRVYSGFVPKLIALMHLCWGNTALFRKSALDRVRGFDDAFRQYEDWHLVARISFLHELAFVDVPVMLYRRHEAQISRITGAGARGYLQVIEDVWKGSPEFYRDNKALVDRAVGSAHFQIGTAAASIGDFKTAEKSYLKSIVSYPRQRQVYVEFLKSVVKKRLR